jgi:hypothetical protein
MMSSPFKIVFAQRKFLAGLSLQVFYIVSAAFGLKIERFSPFFLESC